MRVSILIGFALLAPVAPKSSAAVPVVQPASAVPAPAVPAAAPKVASNLSFTPEDIKSVRAACEQGGEFHDQAPVVTAEKRGMLDCRTLYGVLGLPIPNGKIQAVAQPRTSRIDLDSCLPPDPVGALMPKINGDDTFGKLGEEEDEEKCRKAAEENRGSILGDLGCMVIRDTLRLGTGAVAWSAAGSAVGGAAAAEGAAASTTATVSAGTAFAAKTSAAVAAGSTVAEGLLGIGEWIANKVKPGQECVTTKKSSCISAAIAGVINDLVFNIKGIWDLVKLPFKAIGSLFSSTKSVEDSMADKKLDASHASPEESASFFSDPAAWLKGKIAQIWAGLVDHVKNNYGCREWSGSATLGQSGAGTCVKPWVCFEAASADQVVSIACGAVGVIGGEALSAYLTGGAAEYATAGVKFGMNVAKTSTIAGGAVSRAAIATENIASKVASKVTTGMGIVANTVGVRHAIALAVSPFKFPIIKQYVSWIGKSWEAGANAASHSLTKVPMLSKAAAAAKLTEGTALTADAVDAMKKVKVTIDNGDFAIHGNDAARAAVESAILQRDAQALEALRYGRYDRDWWQGNWFARNSAESRSASVSKLTAEMSQALKKNDIFKLRADAAVDTALSELKAGEADVLLRVGSDTEIAGKLSEQLTRLQKESKKLVADLGPFPAAASKKAQAKWLAMNDRAQKIARDIDIALGAPGSFARFNAERYHRSMERFFQENDFLEKLGKSAGMFGGNEAKGLEAMGEFLNGQGMRYQIVGDKGERGLQLIDEAGKPRGGVFKLREAANACK